MIFLLSKNPLATWTSDWGVILWLFSGTTSWILHQHTKFKNLCSYDQHSSSGDASESFGVGASSSITFSISRKSKATSSSNLGTSTGDIYNYGVGWLIYFILLLPTVGYDMIWEPVPIAIITSRSGTSSSSKSNVIFCIRSLFLYSLHLKKTHNNVPH